MRFDWFHRLEEGLIAFLLAAMTLVSFSQVVARYVFNYSFTWALELSMVLFAWLIFLGIPYGVRIGSHIGVDSLVKALGRAHTLHPAGRTFRPGPRRQDQPVLPRR